MKAELKAHLRAGEHDSALSLILQATSDLSFEDVQYASIALAKLPPEVVAARAPVTKKLAILGGATTQFLVPLVKLFALRRGVRLEVYEAEFGLFEQEIWSDSPTLRAFGPDVILFHICTQNAAFGYTEPDPAQALQAAVDRFVSLYRTAAERFGCVVLADNFVTGIERPYGSLDVVIDGTRNSLLRAANAAIARSLPRQVFIHDVEMLSAILGKQRWYDPRLYNSAKCAISFECQPHYADSVSAALGALFGRSKKCLILDLDNTLWGGVIGDDGLGGISLGPGVPAGEAFAEFQAYVKTLKERGVLLAVASKNEPATALQPFREHPDTVLREADFSCFVANWEPKDGNIRHIAKQLNIGLDSVVFFDDNPAERQLVGTSLPQVAVHNVPQDPSLFVQSLDAAQWFETLTVTDEDRKRSDFFQKQGARELLEKSTANYDEYLQHLQMTATIEPVSESNLDRTTQLINKTNQFNLTTLRVTESEVREFGSSSDYYTATTRLADKFGDNGLISVVVGRIDAADRESLRVDLWLMSCRVLKRGVEILDMEQLLAFCRQRGVRRVLGRYVPTAKNKLVESHYQALGFEQVESAGPATEWVYDVARPLNRAHFIGVKQ
jgi:FkbH-like protein